MSRKPRDNGDDSGTWLNTYADMVTLLLTFFVVLLSMSTVNQEKFNAFIESFQTAQQQTQAGGSGQGTGSGVTQDEMDQLYEYIKSYVDENGKSNEVEISKIDEVVYIRFSSHLFFEPDQYKIREKSVPTLSFIADGLKQYENKIKTINICGHTAETHRPNSPISDWMLSGERAAAVAIYLQEEKKISEHKIIVMGYGSNFPIGDNATSEGRIQNRRVEMIVVGSESKIDFNTYDVLKSVYDSQQYPAVGGVNEVLIPPTSASQAPESGIENKGTQPSEAVETNNAPASNVPDANVESGVSPYED